MEKLAENQTQDMKKLAVNQKPNPSPHSAAWPWSPHTGIECMQGMYAGGGPSLSPISSILQTAGGGAGGCVVGGGRSTAATGLALSGMSAGISALANQAFLPLCNSPLSTLDTYVLSLASVGMPRGSMPPPGSLPNAGASALRVLAGGMPAVATPHLPARYDLAASFSFPAHSNQAGGCVSTHLKMPDAHLKIPSPQALPFKPHTSSYSLTAAYPQGNTSAYPLGVLSDSNQVGAGHAAHTTPAAGAAAAAASAVSKLSQATQVVFLPFFTLL